MNHHEFIHRNIKAKLISEGFEGNIVNQAANYGIGVFNRLDGKRGSKGTIFDDVFISAKNYAKKLKKATN